MAVKLGLPLPHVCIFDLDGTLVNSLPDIAEALNECLELLGLDPRPVDDYRYLVGEGVPMLCRRVLGQSHPHLVARLTELARAAYRARPLRYTKPYRGVSQLIARLRAARVRLGVLSNKPHDMTVRMVRTFWPNGQFAAIQGYVDDDRRKPNPHYLLRMCESLGVQPAQTWLIGDTPTDVQTAARAGAVFVGVTWGFRTRQDLEAAGAQVIADHPDDIA
jgi:phosphoglycolate phosphatase